MILVQDVGKSDQCYAEWIASYVARSGSVFGRCHDGVEEMVAAFPELVPVPGNVLDGAWGRRGHVWLRDPAGAIVDPAASQYPALMVYYPWPPDELVNVGKCTGCGEVIWIKVPDLAHDWTRYVHDDAECEQLVRAELY